MKFFSSFFKSSQEDENNIKYIFHFQRLLAFQQLFMEQYNDAFAKAAGLEKLSNEAFERPIATLDNPEAIVKYIVPALQKKTKILASMEIEQNEMGEPQSETLRAVYQDFTKALWAMKERAQLQYEGFNTFVNNELIDEDITELDSVELEAMDRAILRLNDVVMNLGLSGEDFLKINCDAFNSVRKDVGLSPMSNQQFQDIYFAGISGQPARFFSFE
jgi:hypothetical protein